MPAWKKGQSGNPNGRPRVDADIKRKALDMLPDVLRALKLALDSPKERVAASALLLDRAFGKAVARQELTGANGGPIERKEVAEDTREPLENILARARAAAAQEAAEQVTVAAREISKENSEGSRMPKGIAVPAVRKESLH